jgi:catechol 2,3-dioxygenase-like lactoylglutathione lyase family enzyme
MFTDNSAVATIPVKNLERAKEFYESTLGLQPADKETQEEGTQTYQSGNSSLLVYESQYAGSNQATAVTWPVDDVEDAVRELKAKGVAFETYDFLGVARRGEVHLTGSTKAAWFKDPDGNIHALVGG